MRDADRYSSDARRANQADDAWWQDELDVPRRGEEVERALAWLPLVLALALLGVTAWITSWVWPSLSYFRASSEALPLGVVDGWGDREELWREGELVLPSGVYASFEGIGHLRTRVDGRGLGGGDEIQAFYKVIGAPVFVERREVPSERPPVPLGPADEMHDGHPWLAVNGRLMAFEDLPRRYRRVVAWYSRALRVPFCGHDTLDAIERVWSLERERFRRQFRLDQGRDPTPAEMRAQGVEPSCVRAYLLVADETPASMLPRLSLWALFAALVLGMALRQLALFWRTMAHLRAR